MTRWERVSAEFRLMSLRRTILLHAPTDRLRPYRARMCLYLRALLRADRGEYGLHYVPVCDLCGGALPFTAVPSLCPMAVGRRNRCHWKTTRLIQPLWERAKPCTTP